MPKITGSKHPKWNGGTHVSDKGYRRISTAKNRNKYEHRLVMEAMLERPIGLMFLPVAGIPEGTSVHHLDHCTTHNCQGNLMLLQECIHAAISRSYKAYLLVHYEAHMERMRESDRWE